MSEDKAFRSDEALETNKANRPEERPLFCSVSYLRDGHSRRVLVVVLPGFTES